MVAHYRDVSKALITDPGIPQQIINEFLANPIRIERFSFLDTLWYWGTVRVDRSAGHALGVDDLVPILWQTRKKVSEAEKGLYESAQHSD